jgi:HEAT repeat protein
MIGLSITHAENNAQSPENQRVMLLGLIQSLHRDAASAQQAAQDLGQMGPAAAPAAGDLIQAFQFDEETVFTAASDALVKVGASSIPSLTLVLGHPNFIVRRRAALTLARFGPEARRAAPDLVGLLTDPHEDVRAAAEKALLQIGDAAIPALKDALKTSGSGTRDVVMATLSRFGSKAVPILLECLRKDDDAIIRSRSAEALGRIQAGPEVQEGLIQALSDLDENVRGSAADSLGQLKPVATAAIGPLIAISEEDHDALARKRAAEALGLIGPVTRESIPGLFIAQRSANADVRRGVIDVLVKASMTWPDPLPLLMNGVKDPDPQVRLKAVQVSAAVAKPGPDVLPLFRLAIGDPVADIRSVAVKALGLWKDNGPAAAAELSRVQSDLNPVIRQQAIQALGNLGMAGLPGLLQALSDSSSLLSDRAGDAIVALGQDAVPALQSLQKGPDPAMQKIAGSLLRRIARQARWKKKPVSPS